MKVPTIEGIIERRTLINFTADPEIIQKIIPQPFRVKVYKDKAMIGICLICGKPTQIDPLWPDEPTTTSVA